MTRKKQNEKRDKMIEKKYMEFKHGYQPSESVSITRGFQPVKSEFPEISLPSSIGENKSEKGRDKKKK